MTARRTRKAAPRPANRSAPTGAVGRREPPIEIDARNLPPLGMPPARFLRDYWQKRPLLIRNAFPGFVSPLSPEDLAGLACETYALSRLIVHDHVNDDWSVETGPFEESRFPSLPRTDWTLLVQDVDKWDRDVAAILDAFRFLPNWRVDDVMVSYAAPDGSVGAHIDQYDVFLLQASGQRHWMISTDPQAPATFRANQELKLLESFEPTDEWLLEPGDMLYLPPGIPHHGIAVGERCMTFSVGLRAPGAGELAVDFAEYLAERLPESLRYGDSDLAPVGNTGEIDAAALTRVRTLLQSVLDGDPATQADWFGRFITRYRAAGFAAPREKPLSASAFRKRLDVGRGALLRHPLSRFAYRRHGSHAVLFVAGDACEATLTFARRLCRPEPLPLADTAAFDASDIELLRALVNAGHLEFVR
jgi:50S ribosomal protein L16 3-hydroxylase